VSACHFAIFARAARRASCGSRRAPCGGRRRGREAFRIY
jgi:hypothetical protein